MAEFTSLKSTVIPLPEENVDTDQIIPARFLKVTDKNGLGKLLFNDWRYNADGSDNMSFVLNEGASEGAQILLAGDNFGCGSSREHAPWALVAWGLRAIISTSFADIFKNNALKNGLLPVEVSADVHKRLFDLVNGDRAASLAVDLESQTLSLPGGESVAFPVDSFAKHCLLNGIDQLGYLQSFEEKIAAHEQRS